MSQQSTSHDWQDQRHPIAYQIGLVATLLGFAVMVCAAIAVAIPQFVVPAEEVADVPTPESRRWNATRETVEYEHMYAPGVASPSFDHMYAKPRAHRY